ncbi:STAS domain-containing protein [Cellulomonas sp. 179-A 9B4 NHS]|uniref:STAS domain-containing protein n=1 Tax=Cellulomonas sp. 179-A 9B4 NHS TaxID=3142379 RepID=UPI0039A2D2AD
MAILPAPRPLGDPAGAPGCTVTRAAGPAPRLLLRGELDRDAAPPVEAVLRSALASDRPAILRLDVGDLWFVDVEGVRVLARTHRAAAARGARVLLERPRPFLLEVAAVVAPDLVRGAHAVDGARVPGA